MDKRLKQCEKYEFDTAAIERRLRLLEISRDDESIADRLREIVLAPNAPQIVYEFYSFLSKHNEFSAFLESKKVDHLKKSMLTYLLSFGSGMFKPEYIDYRLKLGMIHRRIGLPIAIFECAYNKLRTLIAVNIPEELEYTTVVKLHTFVNKTIALDISLVMEGYSMPYFYHFDESIDALKQQNTKYKTWPETDPLTHCLNRTHILTLLNDKLRSLELDTAEMPILLMSVDGLSIINNSFGHVAGDYVLSSTITKICEILDEEDHIGRFSDNIFILLPSSSQQTFLTYLANKIKGTVDKHAFMAGNTRLSVSISFIIGMTNKKEPLKDLLRRLDRALSKSKREKKSA